MDFSTPAEPNTIIDDLHRCGSHHEEGDHLNQALVRLVASARKGTIRDLDFTASNVAQGLRNLYVAAYGPNQPPQSNQANPLPHLYTKSQKKEIRLFLRIVLRLPEFSECTATRQVVFDTPVTNIVLYNLSHCTTSSEPWLANESNPDEDRAAITADQDDESDFCGEMLYLTYLYQHPDQRWHLRTSMSVLLQHTASNNSTGNAKATHKVLQVMVYAIRGFTTPCTPSHTQLLDKIILPLHAVEGKISHTKPLIALFYSSMMECIVDYLKLDVMQYAERVVRSVLQHWPLQSCGNSPKEILMVREITTVLEIIVEEVMVDQGNIEEGKEGKEGKNR